MKTIAILITVMTAACAVDMSSDGMPVERTRATESAVASGGDGFQVCCDDLGFCAPCGGGTTGGGDPTGGGGGALSCWPGHICTQDDDCKDAGTCGPNGYCASERPGSATLRCFK